MVYVLKITVTLTRCRDFFFTAAENFFTFFKNNKLENESKNEKIKEKTRFEMLN